MSLSERSVLKKAAQLNDVKDTTSIRDHVQECVYTNKSILQKH